MTEFKTKTVNIYGFINGKKYPFGVRKKIFLANENEGRLMTGLECWREDDIWVVYPNPDENPHLTDLQKSALRKELKQ